MTLFDFFSLVVLDMTLLPLAACSISNICRTGEGRNSDERRNGDTCNEVLSQPDLIDV